MKPRQKLHVKKGDTVQVISGKDRGVKGKVLATDPEKGRVVVEGVNRVVKHTKVGQSQRGTKTGGIVHQEAPIHVSNVMIVDPDGGRPTRVGYRKETVDLGDGRTKTRSVRISRRSGKDM